MGGRHLPWTRRSLGLAPSEVGMLAHGDWALTQVPSLRSHKPWWKPLVCVALTDPPSRLARLLQSTVQSVLCLGACPLYSDDGYDKT